MSKTRVSLVVFSAALNARTNEVEPFLLTIVQSRLLKMGERNIFEIKEEEKRKRNTIREGGRGNFAREPLVKFLFVIVGT